MENDQISAMRTGAARYSGAMSALGDVGFDVEFTQTGGMNAALGVHLERGYLLITDTDEPLPWDVEDQVGWGVGLYRGDDVSEGPLYFVDAKNPTTTVLLELVKRCLTEGASYLTPRR